MFDSDHDIYSTVNRKGTKITLEVEEAADVSDIAIDFFIKKASDHAYSGI